MELSFSELRTKEVINTVDGRRLGKVCDIVFCYPENRVIGIVVPGCKGFALWKNEQFIDMKNIIKIGDDVILVNFNMPPKPSGRKPGRGCSGGGCNPPSCPPSDPPGHGGGPGGPGGGHGGPCAPSDYSARPYSDRRSYEEYE